MAIVEIKKLKKDYKGFLALNGIDLSLEKGKIVGLLGPNGSGKTTLIKLMNGLLQPSGGEILIGGHHPGVETKKIISYLPDKDFLPNEINTSYMINYFKDFFKDFDEEKANEMLETLDIDKNKKLGKLSKGTREKIRLVLTMSRKAEVYLLDEPIDGVDPAARDFILRTIISNYNKDGLVLISTHLISDVESVLDEVLFLKKGDIILHKSVDEVREEQGETVDEYFREVFAC